MLDAAPILSYYPTGARRGQVQGVWRGILIAVGALIALCSAGLVITAVVEVASGRDGKTSPGVYAGLIVFFLGGTLVGAFMIWLAVRSRPDGRVSQPGPSMIYPTVGQTSDGAGQGGDVDRERRILQFAEKENGRVTVAEVAAHCEMTVAQAKTDLDRMVVQQVAQILVTERGVLVYVFPGFLSDREKASAQDF
jgi:hypothetical protein